MAQYEHIGCAKTKCGARIDSVWAWTPKVAAILMPIIDIEIVRLRTVGRKVTVVECYMPSIQFTSEQIPDVPSDNYANQFWNIGSHRTTLPRAVLKMLNDACQPTRYEREDPV